jgi:hypothetical protein
MSRVTRVALGPGRSFVKVRLPKGVKSAASIAHGKYGAAIDRLADQKRLSTGEGCMLFFVRGKGGTKAIQRCEGRKLRGTNKKQCRNKKKKFVKCSRRR